MDGNEAKQFVLDRVRVDRADIADAKAHLAKLIGQIYVKDIARARADEVVGPPEKEMPLWHEDPRPALEKYARHLSVQFAVFKAAWELIFSGVMLPWGTPVVNSPTLEMTTVRPGGGGHRWGEQLKDLLFSHPEHLLRASWLKEDTTLTDADLYLRTLDAAGLHPGIAEALRQAVSCFSAALYVPAVAMLDAASEGAWLEAGTALATKPPTDTEQPRLASKLADARMSMRSKASAVCDYFDTRKDSQRTSAVASAQLRDTLQWSGLVRDARNVLHWNVAANIPNDYGNVAMYLLAAMNHVKRLHTITTA